MGKRRINLGFLLGLGFFFLIPATSHATLGEIENTIETDTASLKGTRILQKYTNYSVHDIVAQNGTEIKEYVSSDGMVFAVTWSGINHPDLSSLMGTYFKEYDTKRAQASSLPGRKRQPIQTSRVVVMKSGHMRSVNGRAYVPDLVPAGVKPEELN